MKKSYLLLLLLLLCSCGKVSTIDLSGSWQVKLDPKNEGIKEGWYNQTFTDRINLPGCLQEQGFGEKPSPSTKWWSPLDLSARHISLEKYGKADDNFKLKQFLMPRHHYIGAAWYSRDIEIPKSSNGERFILSLERCHWGSKVWVDSIFIGECESLATAHTFDLSHIPAGKHKLTLRIDNGKLYNLGNMSHSVSDQTQGTWNGVVGDIVLSVKNAIYIKDVQCYPSIKAKNVKVVVKVANTSGNGAKFTINANAMGYNSGNNHNPESFTFEGQLMGGNVEYISFRYPMGDDFVMWDEFNPALYNLNLDFETEGGKGDLSESKTVSFGMREFTSDGTHFYVNGIKTFMRGNVDCAVNPRTGFAPMDVERWKEIFKVYKEFGLNYVRFHSWTPPAAAFIAADQMGLYLAPEVHEWTWVKGKGAMVDFFKEESSQILSYFGNHPSFVMMGLGNESGIEPKVASDFMVQWKAEDARRLYTVKASSSSNPSADMEYEIFSHVKDDSFKGGRIRNRYQAFWPPLPENTEFCTRSPQTTIDWKECIDFHQKQFGIPVMSHELAQFCAYPDIYNEMAKYTGYLRPTYLEIAAEQLEERGMTNQLADFVAHSGAWQIELTREEIEAALRTENLAGFQWLSLNDFTGQNTAPVGFTDAFYEPKSYVNSSYMSRFCAPDVILARLEKRSFLKGDKFDVAIDISHFSKDVLTVEDLKIEIFDEKGTKVASGSLAPATLNAQGLHRIGNYSTNLASLPAPAKYNMVVSSRVNNLESDWDFWLYEDKKVMDFPKDITVAKEWNRAVLSKLQQGKTVLLLPEIGKAKGDLPTCFTTTYWTSFGEKGGQSSACGITLDSNHPLFAQFPTQSHASWQWYDLLNFCQPMILDQYNEPYPFPKEYRPLIQPIDSWKLNRKLALVLEAKVGKGKLLICSIDIVNNLDKRFVAKQFRESLLKYMVSEKFNPENEIAPASISSIFDQSAKGQQMDMQGLPTEG